MNRKRIWAVTSALGLLASMSWSPRVAAQGHSPGSPAAISQESSAAKPSKKPALADATRVSTDQALRSAVQKSSAKRAKDDASDEVAKSGVLEFQPTAVNESTATRPAAASKESRKPILKNVHGTVHGSLNSAESRNSPAGASTGVTSGSGKTSIYVETERSRATSPK